MSAELPLAPPSGDSRGDEVLGGSASGSEPPVRALLEQLVELWGDERHGSAPLHLLFASLTVTAVLKASDTEVRPPSLLGGLQQRYHASALAQWFILRLV